MQHATAAQATPAPPRTQEEVLSRYRELRQAHQVTHNSLSTRYRRMVMALIAVAVLVAAQSFLAPHFRFDWTLIAGFAAGIAVVILMLRVQSRMAHVQRLIDFHDQNLRRTDGTEPYPGHTGEDAAPAAATHLYQFDLDITGPKSLFSLLATVRTGIGERGLARYLLDPVSHAESGARQQAVRELLPQTALREQIALLGESRFQMLSATFLDDWLDDPPPSFHPAFRYVLGVTAAAATALLLAGAASLLPWEQVTPNLAAVLALQAAISVALRARVKPLLEAGGRLQRQVRLFAEGIALLQDSTFTAPKLLELQRLSREPAGAVAALKRLDTQLLVVEQRPKGLFLVFSLILAAGCQAAISIATWKIQHAEAMRLWLTAWAEFEALNAVATYAFEHPITTGEHTWPELLPHTGSSCFEAQGLGHPLLPEGIRNDVSLGPDHSFLLISGSNMSGKSTLMRSIGTAAVLAYAGAPVPAASLRLSTLTIGASIALTDSLAEGKSKFLAEVERLAAIVNASAAQPVLFLVDEIFSGTNSVDRRTAADAVLHRLLANGAIGALSTHDLGLTTLATEANRGTNHHMASPDPESPLAFDYRLKPGVNQYTNALAIIRMLGL